jgi:hypothetical protein
MPLNNMQTISSSGQGHDTSVQFRWICEMPQELFQFDQPIRGRQPALCRWGYSRWSSHHEHGPCKFASSGHRPFASSFTYSASSRLSPRSSMASRPAFSRFLVALFHFYFACCGSTNDRYLGGISSLNCLQLTSTLTFASKSAKFYKTTTTDESMNKT